MTDFKLYTINLTEIFNRDLKFISSLKILFLYIFWLSIYPRLRCIQSFPIHIFLPFSPAPTSCASQMFRCRNLHSHVFFFGMMLPLGLVNFSVKNENFYILMVEIERLTRLLFLDTYQKNSINIDEIRFYKFSLKFF